jgi:flagellar basal-body rod modification protein FlgD
MTPSTTSQTTNPGQTLTQQDFLQLLVTQMTSQDPMQPVSDTDMAAQMAQFSALQAAQSTDSDVQTLDANSLLGRTVTASSTTGAVTGTVSGIEIQSGAPQVLINGQLYALNQISAITPAVTPTTPSTTTTAPTTPTPPAGSSHVYSVPASTN